MADLHSLLTENKQPLKEFGYLLLFVSVMFAMTFIIITSFNLLAYAAAVVSITLIIFVIKRLVAYYFEVRLSSTFWL
ncbi:MAG: hypothetical protein M1348_00920, partial [Candidatus Parvarchaeota archaeon]|nr:hypothetical protein [Candidatus Parvarchaeota archaeon]